MYGTGQPGYTALSAKEKQGLPRFSVGIFRRAVRHVHDAGAFTPEMLREEPVAALSAETERCLSAAVDRTLEAGSVPEEMSRKLAEDVFVFSGCKTYHELKEVAQLLRDDKGHIKPLRQFYEDVKAIHPAYNERYLEAEQGFAIHSAQAAAQWAQIEADGDRYDLTYRTAGDDKVRASHAPLDEITLPPSHPFWLRYMTPNGWKCRCRVVQSRVGKYPRTDDATAMTLGEQATTDVDSKGRNRAQMFRFNPGKQQVVFPPNHPYHNLSAEAKAVIVDMADSKVINGDSTAQRIRDMISEMPKNLTDNEKMAIAENNIAIEKALAITKGKPMTVEEADKQNANPNYGKDRAYSINCQTCAPAYALRSKGFNVMSKPCTPGSKLDYLSRGNQTWEIWQNADGTPAKHITMIDWLKSKKYTKMTEKRYREFFEVACKEEGIYELSIGWKQRGGHATILQRFADGELRYIEPQSDNSPGSGKEYLSIDYLCKAGATVRIHECRGIMRIDNKLFNLDYLDIFAK